MISGAHWRWAPGDMNYRNIHIRNTPIFGMWCYCQSLLGIVYLFNSITSHIKQGDCNACCQKFRLKKPSCLDTLLKGSNRKINTSIWFCCMKEKKSLVEGIRNNEAQRPHTCRNPKMHISLVSLLLCCKIATLRCFVWHLCLRMWGEAVRQLNKISSIYKKN